MALQFTSLSLSAGQQIPSIFHIGTPDATAAIRMLFPVFRSIADNESLTEKERIQYAKIARAQLSK